GTVLAAVLAEDDSAQVVIVADAGEDDFLGFCGFPRCRCRAAAEFPGPFLGFGGGAVVDGDDVPALLGEVARHRIAHHAQAQKRNIRHDRFPLEHGGQTEDRGPVSVCSSVLCFPPSVYWESMCSAVAPFGE